MAESLLVLVVALYAAVATSYLEARRRREPPPIWARIAGPAAVTIHLTGLIALSMAIQRSPFSTGAQALSFLAFSLIALYVLLEAVSRVATHGGGFYMVAAVLAALSVPGLIDGGVPDGPPARDALRTVHVGLALLGTAAALAGGLLAIGYLGAYRRVKRHALRGGAEGPSLRGFEQLERGASLLGVILFGAALPLGVRALGGGGGSSPATIWLVATSGLVFVLLGVAGWLWWRRPLRGAVAAWLNLAGTGVVIVAFALVHPLVVGGAG